LEKSLISIFAIVILLTSVGVPVYRGFKAMENNIIRHEFENIGNQLQATTSGIAGMIFAN